MLIKCKDKNNYGQRGCSNYQIYIKEMSLVIYIKI
jgi:hypothetical protein